MERVALGLLAMALGDHYGRRFQISGGRSPILFVLACISPFTYWIVLICAFWMKDQVTVEQHGPADWFWGLCTWISNFLQNAVSAPGLYYIRLKPLDTMPGKTNDFTHQESLGDLSEEELQSVENAGRARDSIVTAVGFLITFFLLSFFGGPLNGIAMGICLMIMFVVMQGAQNQRVENRGPGEPFQHADTIYQVEIMRLGIRVGTGRAIMWKGVLHTPYHVVGSGAILQFGDETFYPTVEDEVNDIVTYGGPPRMERVGDREQLIIHLNRGRLRETVRSRVYFRNGRFFCANLRTVNGLSGSPIFVDREDGYHLVGLTGNNFTRRSGGGFFDRPGVQIEEIRGVGMSSYGPVLTPRYGLVQQFFSPPGTGKTRNVIPDAIRACLREDFDRVWVSAPTRLICQDIEKTLREVLAGEAEVTSLASGGLHSLNAEVVVAPHPVLLQRLVSDRTMAKKCAFIIDETHMSAWVTSSLLNMLREEANLSQAKVHSSTYLLELTATGFSFTGNVNIAEENENVQDMPYSDPVEEVVKSCFTRGLKKVIVFCPTVEPNAASPGTSISERAKAMEEIDAEIVRLHRDSYGEAFPRAKAPVADGDHMIVLTTNVCEVGANLDADAVVDPQLQLRFVRKAGRGVFKSVITPISEAQRVQRRGRVGRGKRGEYHFALSRRMKECKEEWETIDEFTASCVRRALRLPSFHPRHTIDIFREDTLPLTLPQVQALCTDPDVSGAMGAYLKYQANGERNRASERRRILNQWSRDVHAVEVTVEGRKLKTTYFDPTEKVFGLVENFSEAPLLSKKKQKKECKRNNKAPVVKEDHLYFDRIVRTEQHTHACPCDHMFTHDHDETGDGDLLCPCCVPDQ